MSQSSFRLPRFAKVYFYRELNDCTNMNFGAVTDIFDELTTVDGHSEYFHDDAIQQDVAREARDEGKPPPALYGDVQRACAMELWSKVFGSFMLEQDDVRRGCAPMRDCYQAGISMTVVFGETEASASTEKFHFEWCTAADKFVSEWCKRNKCTRSRSRWEQDPRRRA